MDGLAAVQARIAAIEATFASMAAPRAVAASKPAGAAAPSFAAALATELQAASVTGTAPGDVLTPARRLEPGQYGRLEPPAELVQYGNGRIPADALETIGVGNHRLWAPAARSYRRMVSDAAAQGVTIGITDSYRDHATQVRLAEEKGLYSNGGLAARPGTSNHGWGMSVDLRLDDRAQAWMRENGWRYGFVEDVPREPWHWTYRPG